MHTPLCCLDDENYGVEEIVLFDICSEKNIIKHFFILFLSCLSLSISFGTTLADQITVLVQFITIPTVVLPFYLLQTLNTHVYIWHVKK